VDRRRIWPDFQDAWIVHRDPDLVVIDKPTGIPTHAADPARLDDVVTRLSAHLGVDYLGVHQRLDRDTSGVLLFTARREANARIATAFEGRTVEKRYLACVTGWPEGRAKATLKGALAPDKGGGRMRVTPPHDRKGQHAITHVRQVARNGPRALLELVLETGRTHQARVQLAHEGAPIAGDALYGGAPAPRLLLHAAEIVLGKQRFSAKTPPEFEEWLAHGDLGRAIYDEPQALARALARAKDGRFALGRSDTGERATTAFRLVNEAGDALPGLAVDVYDAHLVAQLYDLDPPHAEKVLDALATLGFDGVYLKKRPKQANILVDTRREELAPKLPVRGAPAPDPLVVLEEGIPFRVRLGDGLSTGIFLDQRANRVRVRELSAGQSVVNLFAYTCAFSVAAAVGGAWRTISIDVSSAALERGRENMREASMLDRADHAFVAEDSFAWLARAKAKAERHDLVIVDPPSYSSTKKRRFVAETDYAELASLALAILRPGGRLLACLNHRGVTRAKFRKALHNAARIAGREIAQLKDLPDPSDFPPAIGAEVHMKSALVTLAR
jgi:23S rRNA (cytosine1962-C5)-methyltransferase